MECKELPRIMKGNSLAKRAHSADSFCWEGMEAFWHLALFYPSGPLERELRSPDQGSALMPVLVAASGAGLGSWEQHFYTSLLGIVISPTCEP